ncbi:O-antigen ligase family protein [Polaromonas sp. YR568]|uniref:O-antigen ligase family protein n=1 Tax=Polaromonas sp. YR568 TaxID=1855301 RepID=UPI0027222405|nr:O-antigen ligase family protein [Gammaproteobacteria bacterium]
MSSNTSRSRLVVASLAAASAGLSVAIISLSKVLLVITTLFVLLRRSRGVERFSPLEGMATPWLVLAVLFSFACSLFWTSADMSEALGSLGKYGKFLVIPAFLLLVRTRRDATWVLGAFLGGQAFVLISSWLLFFDVPLIWATSRAAKVSYAVFSSYLDQGIMSAVMGAVFWHLRLLAPNRPAFYLAIALSLLAFGNVFVVFTGRTGHLVGIAMLSLAIFWVLPKRFRMASLLVPPLIFLAVYLSFDKVGQRFAMVKEEVTAYSVRPESRTSSGARLNYWRASLEAIAEKPLLGYGVGSWSKEYQRIEQSRRGKSLGVGNPHQEFLLWGVQLGAGGILLLAAWMIAVGRDFGQVDAPVARAGLSVLWALVLSCLLNSSLYDAYIGDFFCLSLGVLLAYGWRAGNATRGGFVPGLDGADSGRMHMTAVGSTQSRAVVSEGAAGGKSWIAFAHA